jgi:hypothetical protein
MPKQQLKELFREPSGGGSLPLPTGTTAALEQEIAACRFEDLRLGRRFRKLVEQLAHSIGQSIPLACQDWSSTKAAYRFLSNPKVDEERILAGHFQATKERATASGGLILILHDTTEFTIYGESAQELGMLHKGFKSGGKQPYVVRGILMHSSLAVTIDGLPLGLCAIKFWTRDRFKGTNALKRTVNPTRVPIEEKESVRWLDNLKLSTQLLGKADRCVHIGDRESDIYELFCTAQTENTRFLIRTCVDRLAVDGKQTISAAMKDAKVKAVHQVQVRDGKGRVSWASLEVKYQRLEVFPPIGKQKKYPSLTLTVIHAHERNAPPGRPAIAWKLITNMPVRSRAEALEKLSWYAMRWKIETFHKILKSGCRAEETKLRASERIVNLIAVFCILSWRIFWMTMMNRVAPTGPPTIALTELETRVLDRLVPDRTGHQSQPASLGSYLTKIARLGGYLARAKDPPPGNTVMWRGMSRLNDIELGVLIGAGLVGN